MTQQPNPFSELRGLIEDLKYAAMPTKPDVVTLCGGRASETYRALEALLDERDRLRTALTSILFLRPGGPCRNTLVEQMEITARQALSQEIG